MNKDESIEIIEREYYSFDALQLVAVIEELLGEDGGRIFFEADPDLSFPPSDAGYAGIDTDGAGDGAPAATVRLPVMNLLGSASPLPIAFSDRIARGGPNAGMYADFLSIMQNRLHALWIEACRGPLRGASAPLNDPPVHKGPERSRRAVPPDAAVPSPLRVVSASLNDPPVRKGPERSRRADTPAVEKIFKFMTGLSIEETGFFGSGLWLLSNRTRSAQGLKELLYAAFGDIPINIEENLGRYAEVSNAKPLGGAARLGRNAFAGTRVYDETAKFRLVLGPLDRRTYESFMPGGEGRLLMDRILSAYLNEPVICEPAVTCKIGDLPRARLGAERQDGGALGRTAALGTGGDGTAAYVKTLTRP